MQLGELGQLEIFLMISVFVIAVPVMAKNNKKHARFVRAFVFIKFLYISLSIHKRLFLKASGVKVYLYRGSSRWDAVSVKLYTVV